MSELEDVAEGMARASARLDQALAAAVPHLAAQARLAFVTFSQVRLPKIYPVTNNAALKSVAKRTNRA
jgi:hypothetical protein